MENVTKLKFISFDKLTNIITFETPKGEKIYANRSDYQIIYSDPKYDGDFIIRDVIGKRVSFEISE